MLMTSQIKYLIFTDIISLITLILSLLFFYDYGLIGAGLSIVLEKFVKTILLTYFTYRHTTLKLNLIQNLTYDLKKKWVEWSQYKI